MVCQSGKTYPGDVAGDSRDALKMPERRLLSGTGCSCGDFVRSTLIRTSGITSSPYVSAYPIYAMRSWIAAKMLKVYFWP